MKKILISVAALALATSGAFAQNTVDIKTVDTDGNGTVSLAEAQAVWKDLTEDAFKAADADASGELSAEELATLPAPAQ
ncbi:hypothetical protein [Paradevosia shaoguanensis]|jgi:hypothetical protein|uniref:EF-hand domain-containing protein n=1 Tax=Paradevosia shaoguanensis TaxID=1335043 RepID=A0AA41UCJ8_9HYPH|nr:hypothetical protein [Paradevosia shaoguanensis]KFL27758.1 hypothetical protein JP74_05025 [Devosia sp. 17-2-E-8]MBI4048873.1 EF-hand domain-containing protein [Devosia nanyangense]QMV00220.1 EF-hand domain-containing protein [Devosia sp. D6-9]CDP52295.1 hypothetical protein [Devosia sp. DBB001]MCF1743824.1 hypothetical protein [Paradevosia shaoguanensis]